MTTGRQEGGREVTEQDGGSCRGQRAPREVGPRPWEMRKAPEKRPVFFSCPFGKRTLYFLLSVKALRPFLFKLPFHVLFTTRVSRHLPVPPRFALAQGLGPSEVSPPPSLVPGLSPHLHPQDLRGLKKHWPEKTGSRRVNGPQHVGAEAGGFSSLCPPRPGSLGYRF